MKRLPVFLTLAAATLALASCEKEAEVLENPTQAAAIAASNATKPDLLTTGNWHQTGLLVSSTAAGSEKVINANMFGQLKPTMIEQSVHYSADGTYSVAKGARAGSLAPSVPVNGSWQLNAAGDSLTVTLPSGKRHLGVAELTANSLRLVYADAASEGQGSVYTTVYTH